MSRLVAPHVTNQIQITFEIQAKKDFEIAKNILFSDMSWFVAPPKTWFFE